jgi:UPF0716 protein FxsA
MVLVLVLVFIVAPLVELVVFVQVADWIGILQALLLMILVSLAGALVVRHQGLGVVRRVREQLRAGNLPAAELVNGLLIVIAGVLLFLPGFIGDAVAILLLLPPTRALVRSLLQQHYWVRVASRATGVAGTVRDVRRVRNERDVIDVPSTPSDARREPRPEPPSALPPPGDQ